MRYYQHKTVCRANIDSGVSLKMFYDPVGNITQIIDNAQQTHYFNNSVISPVSIYKYDALYRLIEATGRELSSLQMPTYNDFVNNIPIPNNAANAMQNYTQQFQYDELGNIMQMKSVGNWTRDYFYNESDNYLLGHTANTTEYTYDQHGNMLSIPHLNSMLWDYKDELKEVVLNANNDKAYYVYDSTGERVRKIIEKGNIVEERYYLGDYELYRKTTNNTVNVERTTVHVSDDQKRIAMVDNDGTNETIRYLYDNHLGSASLELDEGANIISYEEYHPFGTTSYRSGKTETEVSLKRYKYVGKERDKETGLYYYGARYYAGWIGRFVSVDPLQFEYPHYTPYQYAGNKPVTFIDLDGLQEALTPYMLKYNYREVNSVSDVAHNMNSLGANLVANTYNAASGIINAAYNYEETGKAIASSKIGEYAKTAYNQGLGIAANHMMSDFGNYTKEVIENTSWENAVEGLTTWGNWEAPVEYLIGAKGTNKFNSLKPPKAKKSIQITSKNSLIKNKAPISSEGKILGEIKNGEFIMKNKVHPAGEFDFIVKEDGEILLGRKHTFMSEGADVQAAGTLKIRNNKVVNVTNLSGHYMPNPEQASNFLQILERQGVDISRTHLKTYDSYGNMVNHIGPKNN